MDFSPKYSNMISKKVIVINLLAFVFVKFIFSPSTFQLASILDTLPVFDSRDVVSITNDVRENNDLPLLSANAQLDLAAQEKLSNMVEEGYFAHISPKGTTPWFWINKAKYSYVYAGENLAIGFLSAEETVKAWMESPSHKDNILNSNYRDIGVAVAKADLNGVKGILVVQMFGSQKVAPVALAPSPTPVVVNSPAVNVLPAVTIKTSPAAQVNNQPAPQRVSTITNIPPVSGPVNIEAENGVEIAEVSNWLNNIYVIFSSGLALLSVIAFVLFERSRGMALKTALNFTVFALSILIPQIGVTVQGLVF